MLKCALTNPNRILKVAHRGCFPENKMEGFQRSVGRGCDVIECDIRLSKDKIPMVIHDKTINRTTQGNGSVCKLTKDEINGHGVPSLADLLYWFKTQQSLLMAIELKDVGKQNTLLVNNVLDLLKEHRVEDRVIVISFNKDIIKQSKKVSPHIYTGYVYGPYYMKNPITIMKQVHADVLWLNYNLWEKVRVTALENGIPTFLWTINVKQKLESLTQTNSAGITGIVTDYLSIFGEQST